MHTERPDTFVMANKEKMRIAVLSDTHGRLDRQIFNIVEESDLILHAGDLDNLETLQLLGKAGNVVAVCGNMDFGVWSQSLPREEYVEAGDILIYMLHDMNGINLDPESADIQIVVSGHTHRPSAVHKKGVLYLNPGSPSFPRGGNDASMALIDINGGHFTYRHIAL